MKAADKNNNRQDIDSNSAVGPARGTDSRRVATMLLTRVVDDKRNIDALCDRKHGIRHFLALNENDRAFTRAMTVVALRNRNRIEFILKRLMKRLPPKNARFLNHSLHIAAAQILFMDVPDSAAVNIAVGAVGNDQRTRRFKDLSNAVLRRMVREKDTLLIDSEQVSPLPQWLEKMLRSNYGKGNLKAIATSAAISAAIDISVKADPQKWAKKLDGSVLPTGSIRLLNNTPITQLAGFEEGGWWVQDAAAAIPAQLIGCKPGDRVLELCAAPGGKTAQLTHMGYDVTALDVSKPRLDRLEENLARLSLNATAVQADIFEWQTESPFDAVLLDAPCSSTGTIRRHPDVMWAKTPQDVVELAELQFKMVCKSVDFVRSGGTLVFSNCSMLKEEGENLIPRILEACPALSVSPVKAEEISGIPELINGQGAIRTLPFHLPNEITPELGGLDGFFACRFVKS